MNPLTNVRNIQNLNKRELELDVPTSQSWHRQYKDSAWVFIGGLDYELTEGDMITVFSQYGEIVNINLVRDKKTGKTKGFGFLCYENQVSTVLAVDNLNSIKLCGRTVRVDHVEEYKVPKMRDDMAPEQKLLALEGCGPKLESLDEPDHSRDERNKKDNKTVEDDEDVVKVEAPQVVDGVVLPPRLFGGPVKKEDNAVKVKKERKAKKSKKSKSKKSKKTKKNKKRKYESDYDSNSSDLSSESDSESDIDKDSKKNPEKKRRVDEKSSHNSSASYRDIPSSSKASNFYDDYNTRDTQHKSLHTSGSGGCARVKSEPRSDGERDYGEESYSKHGDVKGRRNNGERHTRYEEDLRQRSHGSTREGGRHHSAARGDTSRGSRDDSYHRTENRRR